MSDPLPIAGRCLCGSVTFAAKAKSRDVTACHCSRCARWSGGVLMSVDVLEEPAFTGRDKIGIYRSSEWGERGFCSVCGASLFWKLVGKDYYTLSAGTLDDPSQLHLALEIFMDDKPAYYAFANDTVKMTGAEATAALIAAQEADAATDRM